MNLVITPIKIGSYLVGLPYGPRGMAIAYSTVFVLWLVPLVAWITRGNVVSFREVVSTITRPVALSIVAGGLAFAARILCGQSWSALPRLVLEIGVVLVAFFGMLWFVAGQKSFYLDLLREFTKCSMVQEKRLVEA